jgi:dTDP-4-dehydrorhamnose reductase
MKILILGVTGMLGNAIFNVLSMQSNYEVWATLRNPKWLTYFDDRKQNKLISDIDILDFVRLRKVLKQVQPDVVINCVGLTKHLDTTNDPLCALPLNALFPHHLANLSLEIDARLIHISTDCVFNGRKGNYKEEDLSDAEDLYGKSKYIGELHKMPNTITLRTSSIGHELNSSYQLIDWFLSQHTKVKGYEKAIFSGLPSFELGNVIKDFVITKPDLQGLYHLSSEPIDKYSLLNLVADRYNKNIKIIADDTLQIDRSLNSDKFRRATGYQSQSWPILIEKMYRSNQGT